jgi:hypothetical protein
MPKTPTGIFPLRSWFGLRKWLADNLMSASLSVTNSLYATLYTIPWLRLLGAKDQEGMPDLDDVVKEIADEMARYL